VKLTTSMAKPSPLACAGRSAALVAICCLMFTLVCGALAAGVDLLTTGPNPASGGGQASFPGVVSAAPSPLGLAAEYMTIDISYLRWLWWPVILYLFWGMAFVCDHYFVRTIDVISERFSIPDDVAGATLMALGCNGPEMSLNTIAIFHPSNIGVGAVVGGEVFNVLVIIGTALLATPDMYLPLKLTRFTFFRDVFFYGVSLLLLYWVLYDGMISRVNAAVLLLGAAVYITTVIYSPQLSKLFSRSSKTGATSRLGSMTGRLSLMLSSVVEDDESDSEPDPEMQSKWDQATRCADPTEGTILGVRVDLRNRLMDRGHHFDDRFIWLGEDCLYVSTAMDPRPGRKDLKRALSMELAYDHSSAAHDHHWHYGGLVNKPNFLDGDEDDKTQSGEGASAPLLNDPRGGNAMEKPPVAEVPGFSDAPWEVIPLEDILYCERPKDQKHFNLHVHRHDNHLGSLITLELSSSDAHVMDAWIGAICKKLKEQRRTTTEAPPPPSGSALLMEWFEWLQFPVKFWVARTIPDMDDPKLQHLYPVSFVMSMVWLAIFAFSVTKACDGIHVDFGISTAILGFTVAAAGTSFPNVFSGMCVARQGKTSMAVANALGANVQNVFLALAVPWTIQSFFITRGPFPMPVDMLMTAVAACFITLAPVIIIYICHGSSLPRWAGWLFLLTYVIYVVFAIGEQVSHCPIWPMSC